MRLSPYPITFPLQANYCRVYLGYYFICNVNMKRAMPNMAVDATESILPFRNECRFHLFRKNKACAIIRNDERYFRTHISSPLSFFYGASRFISNHFCSLLIFPGEILIRQAWTRFPACLTFIPPNE